MRDYHDTLLSSAVSEVHVHSGPLFMELSEEQKPKQRSRHGNTHIEMVSYNFVPNIFMSLSFLSPPTIPGSFPCLQLPFAMKPPPFLHPFTLRLRKQKLMHNRHVDSLASEIRGCFTSPSTSSCEKSVTVWSSHALRLFAAGSPVVSKWIHKLLRCEPSKTEMVREGQAGGMPNPRFP